MEHLQITATLRSPMAMPLFPINLDGLLAAMECERLGLIAGVGELAHVEIPVRRSACGRYHLASVGHHEPCPALGGYANKRAPVAEFMQLGNDKIRSVNTATGRNKAFRIPQPREVIGRMRWWCVGERAGVVELLDLVTHLGKKRSVGHGRVGTWTIETVADPWPGFPVIRPDGTPMRNLPMDTPGLGSFAVGWGPMTYPYWDQARAMEIAQPPNIYWMGER